VIIALYKSTFTITITITITIALHPTPVTTKWNSWFRTVSHDHHAKYVQHYRGFVAKELELSAATNALTELSTLLE